MLLGKEKVPNLPLSWLQGQLSHLPQMTRVGGGGRSSPPYGSWMETSHLHLHHQKHQATHVWIFSCPKSRDIWQSLAWPLESARPRNFQRFQSLPFGNKYVHSFLGNTSVDHTTYRFRSFLTQRLHYLPGSRRFNSLSWVFEVLEKKKTLKFFLFVPEDTKFLESCPYSLIHLLMLHRLWDTDHMWKMLCHVRWWWRQQWLSLIVA